jgi:DNA mismatch repair ATPase MutS
VNAVLAQCGAPVRAARLRLSPLTVAASICILDSLSGGVSRFYAEIHRVKLISDLARGPVPVLFLLDELLSGTNSHDRLAGPSSLCAAWWSGMRSASSARTTWRWREIPESMGERAANCHFEDRFEDGQLIFDYKLKPGVVKTSNALELMRSIGLGVGDSYPITPTNRKQHARIIEPGAMTRALRHEGCEAL